MEKVFVKLQCKNVIMGIAIVRLQSENVIKVDHFLSH